jgi:hypothetical protein
VRTAVSFYAAGIGSGMTALHSIAGESFCHSTLGHANDILQERNAKK